MQERVNTLEEYIKSDGELTPEQQRRHKKCKQKRGRKARLARVLQKKTTLHSRRCLTLSN
eukprot:scaffold32004_cov37-Cyclotella_meneghiniana.AAC.1